MNAGVIVNAADWVMVKAGVVPKVLVPLQSNATTPDPPVTTDETFGVRLEQ